MTDNKKAAEEYANGRASKLHETALWADNREAFLAGCAHKQKEVERLMEELGKLKADSAVANEAMKNPYRPPSDQLPTIGKTK